MQQQPLCSFLVLFWVELREHKQPKLVCFVTFKPAAWLLSAVKTHVTGFIVFFHNWRHFLLPDELAVFPCRAILSCVE